MTFTITLDGFGDISAEATTSPGEWAIVVNGCVNRYIVGTAEEAEAETRRLARGIEFDRRYRSGDIAPRIPVR